MAIQGSDSASERQPLLSHRENRSNGNNRMNGLDRRTNTNVDHEQWMKKNHHLLDNALYPADAFDRDTYWADLSAEQKTIWIKNQTSKEARREWEAVRRLACTGIFEPLKAYLNNYAVAGVGFFVEGYVLFSVGNIMPLFKASWPQCWDTNEVCNPQIIKAIKYMEILGIICGQLVIGFVGDSIGRRWGLIQDATTMLIGTVLLTAMWAPSLQGWTIMYAVAIFVFGLGVGGEYPMTSTTSIEGLKGSEDRNHRGRAACLAFLMQGWGQLANQLVLILLTVVASSSQTLQPPYSKLQTQITFRITFAIAGVCLIYFLYLRIYKMKSVDNRINENRRSRKLASGYDWETFKFMLTRFWARLFASSVCWFCSDFAFYGMQVFRNDLLELVTGSPPSEVDVIWLYNLINIGCQLVGYYMAALFIDHKSYGRRRMQMVGFGAQFILYTLVSFLFSILSQKGTGAKCFQAIYFFANFWVQFGSNSTTFLLAAEMFPVEVRSTAHGFSAAIGKFGALAATVSYSFISDRTKFILAALSTFIGLIITVLFVPDTTGLDLTEMQRAWRVVVDDEPSNYHGVAVHKQHLSWYEKTIRNRQRTYDIDYDRAQRIKELRDLFEQSEEEVRDENNEGGEIDANLTKYFELERSYRSQARDAPSSGREG